jgi:inner membrane protein
VEPVTHVLTGACLSRAGFNRRAAYATLTMAVAAEMPDVDTVWSWRGPVEGFAHHRGITHTFVALPIEAAILVGVIYALHRWRRSRANNSAKPLTRVPVRWGVLYGCALVGLLSHLLLDYTNNYGLRPFYPFNPHWYAASIAFIFDPVIFLLLAFALVLPSVFSLVSAEVGAKEKPFRGRGLAITALLCIAAWWGLRAIAHQRAVEFGMQQTYTLEHLPVDTVVPQQQSQSDASAGETAGSETELVEPPTEFLPARRVLASPNPLDPFRWALAIDYGPVYQLANVDARTGAISTSDRTYPKLPADTAIRAAELSPLGRVYLDWASMPIVTEDAPVLATSGKLTRKVVMRDPRFMGDISWLRLSQTTPLTAVVTVDDAGKVVRESLDGRRERPGRGPIRVVHMSFPMLPKFKFGTRPAETKPLARPARAVVVAAAPPQHVAVVPKLDLPGSETAKVEPPPAAAKAVAETPMPKVVPAPPPAPLMVQEAKPVVAPAPVAVAPIRMPSAAPQPLMAKVDSAKAQPPVETVKPEPSKSAAAGAKGPIERFLNWLHWLANGD